MALKIKIASLFMSMFVIVSLIREPIQQTEIQVVKEVIQTSTKLTGVDLNVFNGILLKFPSADKEVVEKAMTGKVYSDFPDRLDILAVVSMSLAFDDVLQTEVDPLTYASKHTVPRNGSSSGL